MSDHYCVIGKLKIVPIEGAKTLQLGYFDGLPYAVDKSITEDELVAIFLPDGQLSEEFARQNDLFQRVDKDGKRAGGFFGANRKVRSINLMGGKITSVGFVAPLSYFNYTGQKEFKEGDSFNYIGDKHICNKFVTESSRKASSNIKKSTIEERKVIFPQHKDTSHFMRNLKDLEEGNLIYLTYKLDGTSVRIGNIYEEIHLSWWKKLLSKFVPLSSTKLTHTTGTRRVNFGNNNIYTEFGNKLEGILYPGEIIYGEIVGWLDENRPLFNRGGMFMTYGCPPGTRKLYIYNIKWTLPNGQEIDLPWPKVKQRCLELGLESVPEVEEFNYPLVYDGISIETQGLSQALISLSEGPDVLDHSHIKEGICVRVEKPTGTIFLKYKSPSFYSLEDASKNKGEVDLEEVQSEILV